MANNRMFLVHVPTGQAVFLGKRMADGWYGAPENLGQILNSFYEKVGYGDDFALTMEIGQVKQCPPWVYGAHQGILQFTAAADRVGR